MGITLDQAMQFVDVSATLRQGLADGDLIVIIQVNNVDDLVADDCVTVDILFGLLPAGVMTPMLDAMAQLRPGKRSTSTIARSYMMGTMNPLVTFPGATIVGGRLSISSSITWPVDFPGLGTIDVMQPQAAFDITATTLANGAVRSMCHKPR